MSQATVKGLDQLQQFLDTLPAKVEANIMRSALRAGMKTVQNKAQININSVSGDLASSLKISTRLRNGIVRSVLAAKGFQGYKAMWLEYGTEPHLVKVSDQDKRLNRRRSMRLGKPVYESVSSINRRAKSLSIGGKLVGPYIMHPGAKPKPFLRPALDSSAQEVLIAVGEQIKARLQKKHGLDASHVMLEGDE